MQKEDCYYWRCLYRSLYLLIMKEEDINKKWQDKYFFFDEFESELDDAINSNSIPIYKNNEWLTEGLCDELKTFYDFVEKIEPQPWTFPDYKVNPDWKIARQWAKKLFQKIGFDDKGYNDPEEELIFLK